MFNIFLRQAFKKVCSFLVLATVVLQVSAPHSCTDLTIELKNRSLVFVERMVDRQTLFSWWNAVLALPILILMSASVPPCLSTLLPRYVKESTSSRGLSPSMMGAVLAVLTLRIWLFVGWMVSPMRAEFWLMVVVFSCIWCWVCDSNATSSAKSKSSKCVHGVRWIPFFLFAVDVFIIQSKARRNKKGDNRQPCLTPVRICC